MKREEMNDSIKGTGEVIEKNEDLSSDAVNIDHKRKSENGKGIIRKTLIIGFLLISCVSLVYAGVKTLEKRNLNNDQGEIVGSLENEDTDDNNLLDEDINMEQLRKYSEEISGSKEWANKTYIVIDTTVDYPYEIQLNRNIDTFNEYSEIEMDDNILVLPEQLGDYKFERLFIKYQIDFPDEDTIIALIEDNKDKRFIVKEIGNDEYATANYIYKRTDGDLTMEVSLNLEDESSFSSVLENLDVIKVDGVDVLVTTSNDMGTTYSSNKVLKHKGINHFETTWFDSNHKMMINVNPDLKKSDNGVEEEVDGEYILTTTYPENTKEVLISFTELLHEALKSIE